jgi:hypothetical protein
MSFEQARADVKELIERRVAQLRADRAKADAESEEEENRET